MRFYSKCSKYTYTKYSANQTIIQQLYPMSSAAYEPLQHRWKQMSIPGGRGRGTEGITDTDDAGVKAGSFTWYYSIRFFAPFITVLSLGLGTVFYHGANGWDYSTSFFYAVSALLGVLYYVPANATSYGDLFTIIYYIYGAFFLAGVIGTYGGWLVANAPEISASERRKLISDGPQDADGDGRVGWNDTLYYWVNVVVYNLAWEDHRTKYLTVAAVLFWIALGVVYGTQYEQWPFVKSLNFAVGTVSCAGLITPPCTSDYSGAQMCQVGWFREYVLSAYMLIGVPLFAMTLGQFASLMIERTIKQHEEAVMKLPLSQEEFRYATALHGDNDPEILSLGEFTILELLRLGRVSTTDLDLIKEIYDQIDVNNTGQVDRKMLVKGKFMQTYGSFDENAFQQKGSSAKAEADMDCNMHMLTENDRANTLPPDITEDIRDRVDIRLMEEGNYNFSPFERYRTLTTADSWTHAEDNSTAWTDVSAGRVPWLNLKDYNEIIIPLSVNHMT